MLLTDAILKPVSYRPYVSHLRLRKRAAGQLPLLHHRDCRRLRLLAVRNAAHHRAVSQQQVRDRQQRQPRPREALLQHLHIPRERRHPRHRPRHQGRQGRERGSRAHYVPSVPAQSQKPQLDEALALCLVPQPHGPHPRQVRRRSRQEDRAERRAGASRHAVAQHDHRPGGHPRWREDRAPLLHAGPAQDRSAAGWKNIDDAIEARRRSQEATAGKSPSKKNRTPGAITSRCSRCMACCPTATSTPDGRRDYPAGEDDTTQRQMHVVVLDESDKDKVEGVTLYAGLEDEDPYKYLPYEEVDGRGLGVGVIEDLFEAQVWTNYSVKQKKDMLDLAGKIIFQTTDTVDRRQERPHRPWRTAQSSRPPSTCHHAGQQRARRSRRPAQLMSDWNEQAENVTSTYPGDPRADTAARHSVPIAWPRSATRTSALFEYRRQEAGHFRPGDLHRLGAAVPRETAQGPESSSSQTSSQDELEMLSNAVAEHEALEIRQEANPRRQARPQQDHRSDQAGGKTQATSKRNRHGFNDFADMFDDWEGTIDVDTTGEQRDKQALALDALPALRRASRRTQPCSKTRRWRASSTRSSRRLASHRFPAAQQSGPAANTQPPPQDAQSPAAAPQPSPSPTPP